MASKTGYYNVEDYQKKLHHAKGVMAPPKVNILAAAYHIRCLFEGKNFAYGIFGGLAMLCLGYQREQPDLHIAYDDKDFFRLKAKLEADRRVQLPDGMNPLFPAKILVHTGPSYKNEGCTQEANVELNLVPPGSHGTPSTGTLHNNTVLLSVKTDGKLKSFKGLNMAYLIKTLVHYCQEHGLNWDPRKDILFLCQHYAQDVQSVRSQLDQKAVQQNFLGTPFFSRLSMEDQRRCYNVLLGTEPPPTMAITPPAVPFAHRPSASADIDTRPRLFSHQSSPSLGVQSAGLLSPPVPVKSGASHKRAVSASAQSSKRGHHAQPQHPQANTAPRESRTRYRAVSGNQPRQSSQSNIQITPLGSSNTQVPHQSEMAQHRSTSHDMTQRGHNQLHLAAPAMPQTGKSIPNLNAGHHKTLPPFAFAQTPLLNGSQPSHTHVQHSSSEMEFNQGQHHLKSQLGLGGVSSQNHVPTAAQPITSHPAPPQMRGSRQVSPSSRAGLPVVPSKTPVDKVEQTNPPSTEKPTKAIPQAQHVLQFSQITTIKSEPSPPPSANLPIELDATPAPSTPSPPLPTPEPEPNLLPPPLNLSPKLHPQPLPSPSPPQPQPQPQNQTPTPPRSPPSLPQSLIPGPSRNPSTTPPQPSYQPYQPSPPHQPYQPYQPHQPSPPSQTSHPFLPTHPSPPTPPLSTNASRYTRYYASQPASSMAAGYRAYSPPDASASGNSRSRGGSGSGSAGAAKGGGYVAYQPSLTSPAAPVPISAPVTAATVAATTATVATATVATPASAFQSQERWWKEQANRKAGIENQSERLEGEDRGRTRLRDGGDENVLGNGEGIEGLKENGEWKGHKKSNSEELAREYRAVAGVSGFYA